MQHYATVIYLRSLNKQLLLGSKKTQKSPEKLNIAVLNFFEAKKLTNDICQKILHFKIC